MKKLALVALLALTSVQAFAQTSTQPQIGAEFSWTTPIQREDGTALAASEIATYALYEQSASGNTLGATFTNTNTGNVTVVRGTHKYFMRVTDKGGLESKNSNLVTLVFSNPNAPILQARWLIVAPAAK